MASAKKKAKVAAPTDKISSLTDLLAADAAITSRPSAKPSPLSGGDAYDRAAWQGLQGTSKRPVKKLTSVEKMVKGSNKGLAKRQQKDAMMMLDASAGRGYDQRLEEDMARKALEAKAKKYNARNFTEEELQNSNVDFASKQWDRDESGSTSGGSESDVEASSSRPAPSRATALAHQNGRSHIDQQLPTSFGGRAAGGLDDAETPQYGEAVRQEEEWATYEDEFQRERQAQVRWLQKEGYAEAEDGIWRKSQTAGLRHDPQKEGGFSYTKSGKDLQEDSNAQYGEQSAFPVYEPSEEYLARLRDQATLSTPSNATNAAGQTHFDPEVEKRTRNAAAYGFSKDEDERRRQLERLKRSHEETDRRRAERIAAAMGGGVDLGDEANPVVAGQEKEKEPVVLTEAERAKLERKRLIEAKKEEMARKRAKKAHAGAPAESAAGGGAAA